MRDIYVPLRIVNFRKQLNFSFSTIIMPRYAK